jgi:hypothetical protein
MMKVNVSDKTSCLPTNCGRKKFYRTALSNETIKPSNLVGFSLNLMSMVDLTVIDEEEKF